MKNLTVFTIFALLTIGCTEPEQPTTYKFKHQEQVQTLDLEICFMQPNMVGKVGGYNREFDTYYVHFIDSKGYWVKAYVPTACLIKYKGE